MARDSLAAARASFARSDVSSNGSPEHGVLRGVGAHSGTVAQADSAKDLQAF